MKRLTFSLLVLLFCSVGAGAQTMADDAKPKPKLEEWNYAFSSEGRQNWAPEFTVRTYAGFVTEGVALTGGMRIDDKRTIGLMLHNGKAYDDAAPANRYFAAASLYMRKYHHFSSGNAISIYNDFNVGAAYVYKIVGNVEDSASKPGDIEFMLAWEPGVCIRFWKDVNVFIGPTISSYVLGLHLGVGF